jgi:cell division GTPase FtsZ
MNRREAIKIATIIGAAAAIPKQLLSMVSEKKPLHIIGFGGAGSNFVEYAHAQGVKSKFTCISDPVRENLSPAIKFFRFEPPPEVISLYRDELLLRSDMSIPLEVPDAIYEIFAPDDNYVIVAGLGGYTGTFFMEHFAEWLAINKKSFTALCSLPFTFERGSKRKYINRVHEKYKSNPDFHFIPLPNYQAKYGDLPITDFFEVIHKEFLTCIV